jgi:hypothetical protein
MRDTFKETYEFECCKCGKQLWAAPSILMTGFGMNQGHGACPSCKTSLHLEIEGGLNGERMISRDWKEWLAKKEENYEQSKN